MLINGVIPSSGEYCQAFDAAYMFVFETEFAAAAGAMRHNSSSAAEHNLNVVAVCIGHASL